MTNAECLTLLANWDTVCRAAKNQILTLAATGSSVSPQTITLTSRESEASGTITTVTLAASDTLGGSGHGFVLTLTV